MADEDKKTEDQVEDKTTEEKTKETVYETVDEVSEEVKESMDDFDAKIDSEDDGDDDDSTEDDKTSEGKSDKEEVPEDKKADDDDSGKEKSEDEELSKEDKEIAEAEAAIAAEAKAEAGKTDAEKEAERLAAEQKAKNEADAKAEAEKAEKYVSDLDPETWDEEAIKHDTERGQKALDEKNAIVKQNQALQTQLEQAANQRYADWMDRKIDKLGSDFHGVLGDGDFEDLEPDSDEMNNRIALGNKMTTIAQAYQRLGRQVPTNSKLFAKAVDSLFKDVKDKDKKEAETVDKLKKRSSQAIGKGSNKSKNLTAEEVSANKMKEFDKKIDD